MRFAQIAACLACAGLSSISQVLMRAASAAAGQQKRSFPPIDGTLLLAVAAYGCALLLWLHVLTRVPLSQAFAFLGLTFIIVPLLANRLLGDPVNLNTWLGGAVIIAGILITNWRTG